MALSLREKQSLFVKLVSLLIQHATIIGYELTFGEAWRTPEQAAWNAAHGSGIKNSLHIQRLAIDFNLFKDGKLLNLSEDHKPLGEWWEAQSTPDYSCAWGGRFGDGNHYSIEYNGVK